MPMRLEGSCNCGAVRYGADSHTPFPYMRCYCTACRKMAGGGGYAVNIMGVADTLTVEGRENIAERGIIADDGEYGPGRRSFCSVCGTMLWNYDPRWPELVHPFASSVDTDLPEPPETCHIMLDYKAPWVTPQIGANDQTFARYPDQSIEDWHRSRDLWID